MSYIEEDKTKGIKEDYIPDWYEDIQVDPYIYTKIPGLNEPQINQEISVET